MINLNHSRLFYFTAKDLGVTLLFSIGQSDQIISRNLKKPTKSNYIIQRGLAFSALYIGYFTLSHIDSFSKLTLIHILIFTQISDFVSKRKLHDITPKQL